MSTPEETLAQIGQADPAACGPRPAWTCEFCHAVLLSGNLPTQWDIAWQAAVCPSCRIRVQQDGGYAVVKGGAYSEGRPDPRGLTQFDVPDLVALVRHLVAERDRFRDLYLHATDAANFERADFDRALQKAVPDWRTVLPGPTPLRAFLVASFVRERDEARALAEKACAERDAARAELIKGMIAQVARLIEERDAHERPLPNTNEPEDQHVPHIETEDEP